MEVDSLFFKERQEDVSEDYKIEFIGEVDLDIGSFSFFIFEYIV